MKSLYVGVFTACVGSCVGAGSTFAQCFHGPCGPADLNGDGKLGYEDVVEFLRQLAGNPGTYGGNCSDFDQDGDSGTDADIEAFFAAFKNPATACGRAPNDICANACSLGSSLGSFTLDTRYSRGTGELGSSPTYPPTFPLMSSDIWYKWHCGAAGTTTVTTQVSFPSHIVVYPGLTCPTTSTPPIAANGYGSASFTAVANADYLIRIGARADLGLPIGGQGTFTVRQQCPHVGLATSKLYSLTGPGTGAAWSWRLSEPLAPFINTVNQCVPGVNGTTLTVAQTFAASINSAASGLSCPTNRLQAKATSLRFFGRTYVFLSIRARGPFQLYVGPCQAACAMPSCLVASTLPACSFNPDINEEPTTGVDCNGNEWDDTIDIAFGDSADVNNNGVPDECELLCGTADFNGDGDIGTDQDIAAFFACLSGDCCPTCFSGGADFNGDGDIATDGDIEAFFRVLAGGHC